MNLEAKSVTALILILGVVTQGVEYPIQHEMNLENPHQQNRDHIRKFVEDGEVVRSKLEKLVQDRLWDSHTINADPS